jgi:steroid 5-alpha reductase family enzyme
MVVIPAFIVAAKPSEQIHILDIIGLLVWTEAFTSESLTDIQKLTFL